MKTKLDTTKLGMTLGEIDVEVVGVATTPQPVMGELLILHAPAVKSAFYPYEYIACPAVFLQKKFNRGE